MENMMMESSKFSHPYGIPLPSVMHQVLDDRFVMKFREVLIIGDIHGCYDEMMELLRREDALTDSTLKIFVGDLVNKGPKSRQVIKKLSKMNSALSVRGNHDELILREYFYAQDPFYTPQPRDRWMSTLSFEEIMYLSSLPYTVSIPSLNSLIVHAGLISGIPLKDMHPMDMVTMRDLVVDQCFLDGTDRSEIRLEPWAAMWSGPEHVYFGHDARLQVQIYPYATGLDTGCVYGNKLSGCFISGPRKGSFIDLKAFRVYARER